MGYGWKEVPTSMTEVTIEDARQGLTWAGFLGMSDPVRTDVAESLRKTKEAGIKLIVIT